MNCEDLTPRLILGIGNEYCGNDALGIIIARRLKQKIPDYNLLTGAFTGIDFLEAIENYDEVIVIDSIYAPEFKPGTVRQIKLEEFAGFMGLSFIHSMNLATAIEVGRQLQFPLPEKMKIFGITVDRKGMIGEQPDPEIIKEIDQIAEKIIELIKTSTD